VTGVGEAGEEAEDAGVDVGRMELVVEEVVKDEDEVKGEEETVVEVEVEEEVDNNCTKEAIFFTITTYCM